MTSRKKFQRRSGDAGPQVLFVAWTRTVGRSREIAAALDGEAFTTHPAHLSGRRLVLPRYLVNTARTLLALRERQPDVVIVTNPPTVAAVLVWAWATATRSRYVLDSHPSAFGAKDHKVSQRLLPVHRFLARRAAACLVTTNEWIRVLDAWGARGVILHEAPPLWLATTKDPPPRGHVLFPGVFAHDEPIDEVIALARLRPDVEFHITGDPSKCPDRLVGRLPANARLVGYLDAQAYETELRTAVAVLALTTEPTSVMRAAYEAVYARRPLVVSDWPAGRDAFPYAVHAANHAEDLARGIDEALASRWDTERTDEAFTEQGERWKRQLQDLMGALSTTWSRPTRTL